MKIRYDAEVDAMYLEFRPLAPGIAECRELTPEITAEYGPDGKLAGLEILDASLVFGDEAGNVVLELAAESLWTILRHRMCSIPATFAPSLVDWTLFLLKNLCLSKPNSNGRSYLPGNENIRVSMTRSRRLISGRRRSSILRSDPSGQPSDGTTFGCT